MPLSTPIVQLIDRDPIAVDIRDSITDAARVFARERFHHLPVVDGRRLVGMLSIVDMLRLDSAVARAKNSDTADLVDRRLRLSDVMQKNVVTVSHMATVADAAGVLSAGRFHAVPIVNTSDDHLVGIITTTDLIGHMLEASPEHDLPPDVQRRMTALEQVYKAARNYLQSGMAITEHEQLERVLEAAQRAA